MEKYEEIYTGEIDITAEKNENGSIILEKRIPDNRRLTKGDLYRIERQTFFQKRKKPITNSNNTSRKIDNTIGNLKSNAKRRN